MYTFRLKDLISEHKENNGSDRKLRPKDFMCIKCSKKFQSNSALRRHIETHQEDRPYACDLCPKTFKTKEFFRAHHKAHFLKYKCKICKKVYQSQAYLRMHRRKHNKDYSFTCLICNTGYVAKQEYFNHMYVKHGEALRDLFQCEFCGKKFASSGYLRSHREHKHWNEFNNKPLIKYDCTICNNHYKSRYGLLRHKKREHSNVDLSVLCGICGKRISSKDKLKLHERIHTGYKPFNCQLCPKAFKTKYQLKEHFRVHTGERPYVCTICNKGFTQRTPLRVHMRIHQRDGP